MQQAQPGHQLPMQQQQQPAGVHQHMPQMQQMQQQMQQMHMQPVQIPMPNQMPPMGMPMQQTVLPTPQQMQQMQQQQFQQYQQQNMVTGGLLLPGPNEPLFLPPGTATLEEDLDKRLIVLLRDGRQLIGLLRSYDQFSNLILQRTVERIQIGTEYGDEPRGLYVVRGENIVLMEMVALLNQRRQQQERQSSMKVKVLAAQGFSVDSADFE